MSRAHFQNQKRKFKSAKWHYKRNWETLKWGIIRQTLWTTRVFPGWCNCSSKAFSLIDKQKHTKALTDVLCFTTMIDWRFTVKQLLFFKLKTGRGNFATSLNILGDIQGKRMEIKTNKIEHRKKRFKRNSQQESSFQLHC